MTPQFDSKNATYFSQTRLYTVEASELGLRPGHFPPVIEMVSEFTSRVAKFEFSHLQMSRDGEEVAFAFYRDREGHQSLNVYND